MDNQFLITLLQLEHAVLSYVVWFGVFSVFLVVAFNLKSESRLHRLCLVASALSIFAPVLHFLTRLIIVFVTDGQFQLPIPALE